MEKRRNKRYPRRFKVRFGEKEPVHSGLTADVSVGGLFIVTSSPAPIGGRLVVELTLEEGRLLHFECAVARQSIVQPQLRPIFKGGFGVRFVSYPDLLAEMVPHLKDKSRCQLCYASREAFNEAWQHQLSRGGAFVMAERAHQPNAVVNLELDLPFLDRQFLFPAKVMNVTSQPDGRWGTAVLFVDAKAALAELSPLINPVSG